MAGIVERVLAKRAEKARKQAEADDRARFLAEAKGDPGMRWRGAYDRGVQYEKGDVVSHKGSSYIATDSCKGITPPTNPWEPVALRGRDGKAGKDGETGAVLIGGGASSSGGSGSGPGGPVYWADILEKPEQFQPEAHGHTIAEVEGLPEALDGKEVAGAAAAAMVAHEAAENPHPQYAAAAALSDHIGAGGDAHAEATTGAAGFMSASDKTKLDGVEAGATANASDADLRDRSTHTGEQGIDTITGLESALAAKVSASDVGAANGVAPLGADNKVPAAYLPGFVDDVIEAADFASLPGTGEAGKLYVTLDNSKAWRWSGSAYVEISASPGSTDAVAEGSINLYFTADRVRGAVLSGLSVLTNAAISATDTVLQALGKLQAQVTTKLTNNISASDRILGRASPGAGAVEEIPCTAAGRLLLAAATAESQLTALGMNYSNFTPLIRGGTTAGAGTYTSQSGIAVEFGNLVFFTASLTWTAHTGTGRIEVIGMPGTPDAVYMVSGQLSNVAMPAGTTPTFAIASVAGQARGIVNSNPTGGGAAINIPMDTAGTLFMSGFYKKS